MQYVWTCLGIIALSLGTAGIVLPLLPTVPFLLLAAFFFARGSDRLHHWLITHRIFGPPIEDWQTRGAIGRSAKYLATVSVVFVFGLSFALNLKPLVLGIQFVTLSAVMVFIWTRPEH